MRTRTIPLVGKAPMSAILFIFFFSLYSFTMAGWIQYGDEVEKYLVAQSIVDRHDFAIRPTAMYNKIGADSRTYSTYELGQSVIQVPFYALGRALFSLFSVADVNWMGQLVVGLVNPILTALTCLILFKTCSRLKFSFRTSLSLALIFGVGTIAWPYSKGFTREPLLAFLILLAFYFACLFSATQKTRWLLLTSVASGYLVFSKFLQGMLIPLFAIFIFSVIFISQRENGGPKWSAFRRAAGGTFFFLLPIILFLGLQISYALIRFGTVNLGVTGARNDFLSDVRGLLSGTKPGIIAARILFSSEKSIFLYSPPLLLTLFAWLQWPLRKTREGLLALSVILISIASSILRPDGDGGTWWGTRYLVQVTPLLIIPIGVLLELKNLKARWFWTFSLGILCLISGFVQGIGAFSNTRDYLDITGTSTTLAGQMDFLRHGAFESLAVYLSPNSFPIRFSPYAGVLSLMTGIFLGWIVMRFRQGDDTKRTSTWHGLAVIVLALLIEFSAFIMWIVMPYPRIRAENANTRFFAGNSFLNDHRSCEASWMYFLALQRGTVYQQESATRLSKLLPRAKGDAITAQDLYRNVEATDNATVTFDKSITLSDEATLRIAVPPPKDETARVVSDPISVQPNGVYELSGWLRTENVYGAGRAIVSVYEDDGMWGNRRGADVGSLDETTGWSPFQKTITILPTTHRIFVTAGLWNTYGVMWIDGLQLSEISDANPPSVMPQPCQ